jgi:hypothetical protein
MPGRVGGCSETPQRFVPVWSEPSGALQRGRSGREPGTAARVPRGHLECGGHGFVGTERGGREMPRALLGPGVPARVGERAMRRPSLGRWSRVVERRPHEGVAELEPGAHQPDEAGVLGSLQRGTIEPQGAERASDDRQLAGGRDSGNEQRSTGLFGQCLSPPGERALDAHPGRQRLLERRDPGKLIVREHARQLDQRERVPPGRIDQPVGDRRPQAEGAAAEQHRGG